ncbi:MAG: divergent polysaccharide deacetylase family protein [Gammaproteobacteria bacterium]
MRGRRNRAGDRQGFRSLGATLLLAAVLAGVSPAPAVAGADEPAISIIIDDLGGRFDADLEAVRLPGPVACAFLPHDEYTRQLAELAYANHKEVMLHLPMQTVGNRRLDAGGLTMHMTHREFLRTLAADIAAVPHLVGINNHMGSLLTQHAGDMLWLMRAIHHRGDLFFVDSRTTKATVAMQVAMETHVPTTERDVFLDDDRSIPAIRAQFQRLLALARAHGSAVAIGHPHPHTLRVLREMLPQLADEGIRLIPVRAMIRLRQQRRESWQASLSPSPKAARKSKPSP